MSGVSNYHRLSICMIVKDEAALLARCLRSASVVADEIVVVDTGSSDDSVAIARDTGAKVILSEWRDDFSTARNLSLQHASGDWILWLDADDVIPAESVSSLVALKSTPPDRVYALTVRNEKPGGTGSSFVQARMFPNRPEIRFEGCIHEQMMPSALRLGLVMEPRDILIEHHGYALPEQVARKAKRNIDLLLRQFDPARPDPVMCIELADAYLLVGNWDGAQRWYAVCAQIPGVDAAMPAVASHAHLGLGKCCIEKGEHLRALDEIAVSLKLCPDRPDALYSLSVAQEFMGRIDCAIGSLRKILHATEQPLLVGVDFREATIKAYLRLERLLRDQGRLTDALQLAGEARQRLPHRPEIHTMAGQIFFRAGMLMDALHCFEASLAAIRTGNIDAYVGLCQIYLRAGREQTAQQTLAALAPVFSDRARYWALKDQIEGGGSGLVLPPQIRQEDVESESVLIRRAFGLDTRGGLYGTGE